MTGRKASWFVCELWKLAQKTIYSHQNKYQRHNGDLNTCLPTLKKATENNRWHEI